MSDQQAVTPPAAPVLESMTLGMILDKAFHLYGRDFLPLVATAAIAPTLYAAGYALILISASTSLLLIVPAIALFIAAFLATACSGGAMTMIVSGRYLGHPMGFAPAYAASLRKLGPLVGATILVGLLEGVGAFTLYVLTVIFALSFAVTTPAIMLESSGGGASLGRSRFLMKGWRWRALVLYLVYLAAVLVMYLIGSIVVIIVTGAVTGFEGTGGTTAVLVGYVIGVVIALVVLGPFPMVVSVLLYYNQRIRKEGFDLAFQADALAPRRE